MACNITAGRLEGCKDAVGGLNAIYFVNFGAMGDLTISDETVTGIAATTPDAFKYDLRGTSTFDQSLTSSRDNGTTFAEQTLTVSLKKQDATTHKEVKLLAYGRPHVAVEDYNGNVFVMGLQHGAEVTGGSISTGASMDSLSGYTLTLNAQEVKPANFVNAPTAANPFSTVASGSSVTVGTNS